MSHEEREHAYASAAKARIENVAKTEIGAVPVFIGFLLMAVGAN